MTETTANLIERRQRHLAPNLALSYERPLHLVRGERHFLYDTEGAQYLDAYNNVPHVGHCNRRVVQAVSQQMAMLNVNSRYLYETNIRYAEELCALLPDTLSRCFFVNSASEANEIALRLARAHTGARQMIVMQHGYHGGTTGTVDISPYKFAHPSIGGAPPWVTVVPQPNLFSGDYRDTDQDPITRYLDPVDAALQEAHASGEGVCAFICESMPSVGGQIVLPPGYLKEVYGRARSAGAVCIVDDVQTAIGRTGDHFWGFEYQDVVPDILVLGKPIGNGYPLAAVITTEEIAQAFSRGPSYFSTFGGSTVSCAAGAAVLDVIHEERMQASAKKVGAQLRQGLLSLQKRFSVIGDVRGAGLFVGVELVLDRDQRTPAPGIAAKVVNALRERQVLIGRDGPHGNVLKIRPPMTFDLKAVDRLLTNLYEVLGCVVCSETRLFTEGKL